MSVPLHNAMGRYGARFGVAALPMVIVVPPSRYPELIAALDQAVERGRELTLGEVERIAGCRAPEGWDQPHGPLI